MVAAVVSAINSASSVKSRTRMTSPPLLDVPFQRLTKAKDARTRASWGHSGADPPQPSPHTDYPRSKSAGTGCRSQDLSADLERGLPSTPEFHRATAPELRITGHSSQVTRLPDISELKPVTSLSGGLTGCHRRSGIDERDRSSHPAP